MIDSCGLHIGCFLTCTSGVNTLTVELLATATGTHTIEYYFLDRVIRFEIEATDGTEFVIPTTYFNESGDARIKIVQPDGTYFTHTVGTTVYDTFYLSVKSSTDSNFAPLVAGAPFATQGYVNTAIAAAIAALPTIASGTYTPVVSNETNLTGTAIMTIAQYLRVGNTVTVSGRFTVDAAGAGATRFDITLPVVTVISNNEQVAGVAFGGAVAGMGAEIIGQVTGLARVQWIAVDVAIRTWSFILTYKVT